MALAAVSLPGLAAAETGLHCLGTRPGFMFSVEDGDTVRFDYLGDGRFGLEPALEAPFDGFRRFVLVTAVERWDVYLETRACQVINMNLPLTLEVAVPTSSGLRPLTGCCIWAE